MCDGEIAKAVAGLTQPPARGLDHKMIMLDNADEGKARRGRNFTVSMAAARHGRGRKQPLYKYLSDSGDRAGHLLPIPMRYHFKCGAPPTVQWTFRNSW
jgi:enolase